MDLEFLNTPQGALVAIAATVLIVSTLFNFGQVKAHWKQWAIDASNAASRLGMVHIPKFLNALAAGDLKTIYGEAKALKDIFSNPAQLASEFGTVVVALLKDPTQGPPLLKLAGDVASGKSADVIAADGQAIVQALPAKVFNAALLPHLAANPALAAIVATAQALGLSPSQIEAAVAGHAAALATQPPAPAPQPTSTEASKSAAA